MAKKTTIEAVDRTFRDIMDSTEPFGGKIVVFGGDFRQVLPVVPRATRQQTINESLVKSYLWKQMEKLQLTKNMRAHSDSQFAEYLLKIGNGTEPSVEDDYICLTDDITITGENDEGAIMKLLNVVYPDLEQNATSSEYMTNRVILSTTNEYVDQINEKMIQLFPGKFFEFMSFDEAIDDTHNYYQEEFLNSLLPNGIPPHKLMLKANCPVILLRNLDPANGLCNGTRMVCREFRKNIIYAEITTGQNAGKQVFLPRIPMSPANDEGYPFKFKRKQFPIRLCFAMTINKAQGQTIPNVGVYLPQNVFSHGQLYVALSRGISMATTKLNGGMKKEDAWP
ncbi:ATP-dependent DNA helicase PIF1-like [Momordica charantia]|uniref:ATP-dependent DNA helicase n=1 Tax=Momordica charantia TaxID=3673 RepID=A0A6J1DFU4_MOMCH|nr:ATP-dependent DNA helicase PIF1-like [Momordica charantia]